MNRLWLTVCLACLIADPVLCAESPYQRGARPDYLKGYEAQFEKDPNAAARAWFHDARYGLFMHFGVYSIEGYGAMYQKGRLMRGDWDFDPIPVAEYEKLMDRFTIENFSADDIADLAVEAGMKYITITAKHCDGFCLWDSKSEHFNSANSAAKIDIIAELSRACRERGLGFFPFWEVGYDFRHPHGHPQGRIKYEQATGKREPAYAYGDELDVSKYVDFMFTQIKELLQYDISGIWLDGYGVTRDKADLFRFQELYDMIHQHRPELLILNKPGPTGTEDVISCEFAPYPPGLDANYDRNMAQKKPIEICEPMGVGWGWVAMERRKKWQKPAWGAATLWNELKLKNTLGVNFLLNCGPRGDGTIHPDQQAVLREVGARIRREGFPVARDDEELKKVAGRALRQMEAKLLRHIINQKLMNQHNVARFNAQKAIHQDPDNKARYEQQIKDAEQGIRDATNPDWGDNRAKLDAWYREHPVDWFDPRRLLLTGGEQRVTLKSTEPTVTSGAK